MKIKIILIGKTNSDHLAQGIEVYRSRVAKYLTLELQIIPTVKSTKSWLADDFKKREGEQILRRIQTGDFVVLLDENGKTLDSVAFADFVQHKMNIGLRQLIFVVGGAYGFSPAVYSRADFKLSLSKMTFSHQLIRLIFMEQLYRAFSIINNEPYHNP
jgi:23S rRNA (pseudouridine1915-N3)-methyltransferase